MKKLKLFAISLCAMFVAVGAVSADNSEYPTVTDATKPDSLIGDVKPTIEGSETANVTVTVKAGEWHLLDLENDLNRPDGYTWVGLSFDMPEGVSEIKFNGDDTEHTGDFVEYFGFNVDELKEYTKKGEDLTKNFVLSWTKDEKDYSLNITIIVEADKITVKDTTSDAESSDTPIWDEDIYETTYDQGVTERTHNVAIEDAKNGKVETDSKTALEGEEVTLTVTPDKGYELDALKAVYTDEDGNEVELTIEDNTFVMPANDVTITATFKAAATSPKTLDGITTYMILGALSLLALVTIIYGYKKTSYNN